MVALVFVLCNYAIPSPCVFLDMYYLINPYDHRIEAPAGQIFPAGLHPRSPVASESDSTLILCSRRQTIPDARGIC
ncbi:hypothetical protein RSAG8_00684, partial [Rhizoctonia solani AG-8 WAC10335]